jgi:hypothetical protein
MHASAQPVPRVRRIDFINQLSAPFTADSAPAGQLYNMFMTITGRTCMHAPGPAGPHLPIYAAPVYHAFWCQSTALVVSAVAQTLAGGANSQPASRKSCCC